MPRGFKNAGTFTKFCARSPCGVGKAGKRLQNFIKRKKRPKAQKIVLSGALQRDEKKQRGQGAVFLMFVLSVGAKMRKRAGRII